MGDLHGSCRALKQCLKAVKFDYRKDQLIQLGTGNRTRSR